MQLHAFFISFSTIQDQHKLKIILRHINQTTVEQIVLQGGHKKHRKKQNPRTPESNNSCTNCLIRRRAFMRAVTGYGAEHNTSRYLLIVIYSYQKMAFHIKINHSTVL